MADSVNDHALDSVEAALERARKKGDYERAMRLEMKRDRIQAMAFRALQRRLKRLPK